jgi:hypothetical protein
MQISPYVPNAKYDLNVIGPGQAGNPIASAF